MEDIQFRRGENRGGVKGVGWVEEEERMKNRPCLPGTKENYAFQCHD